ncbi:hypothetical protein BCR37DRAFT_257926 [Protomyces lactucae-debilis]|uniref:NADPH:adrenodoxin oxidoreductase, mitochondrial n=1 Tax=Protomyces lactucae-debilis TaxID=2754530 RepID=A0A1Y2FMD9_PROLT|nr:uncharacterized protein BCR37DRAFT_257926 [Protomyces lactucae-debilis]ORY85108.1 hypothetical protein BCR37DRAFT_257926 [Protomyces lactucae-debilis]
MLKNLFKPTPVRALVRTQSTSSLDKTIRCAIIGSGPAGFYTASRLLSHYPNCSIDIYEALPVPYGLARYGVAPDHPEVKNVTHKFDEVASSKRVRFFGNVHVGKDVSLKSLASCYDSIVFSYGASSNRSLGVPGEDLPGVVTARSFVGWYNGLPETAELGVDLRKVKQAVIVGQGNVALDIARILLSSVDSLRKTDISADALQCLSESKIDSVSIVGRRGPLEASYTIKEVRELIKLPEVHFINSQRQLYVDALSQPLARPQKRLMELLAKSQPTLENDRQAQWDFRYRLSPTRFCGSSGLERVEFQVNDLKTSGDRVVAVGTDQKYIEEAQVAFTSIGYKAEPLLGMSDIGIIFDTTRNIIPNEAGRVQTLDGTLAGLYCAGWAKNGPVGVIASTMRDAYETADNILLDWRAGLTRSVEGNSSAFVKRLSQSCAVIDWNGWKRIEQFEFECGQRLDRPSVKVTDVKEMIRIAAK